MTTKTNESGLNKPMLPYLVIVYYESIDQWQPETKASMRDDVFWEDLETACNALAPYYEPLVSAPGNRFIFKRLSYAKRIFKG